MSRQFELGVQAFLDGQLTKSEARQVEARLASDEAASRLLDELRWTRSVLAANEPSVTLAESREFYWSKIKREIRRAENAAMHRSHASAFLWDTWKRCLAPLSGLALVLLVVVGIFRFYSFDASGPRTRFLAQVESPSEEMGAFSFGSESENVFVIWLYERSGQTRSEINLFNDMVIQ